MQIKANRLLLFKCFGWLVFSFFLFQSKAQQILPYKNSKLPVAERVKDLLSRMTPEEKFFQLFMIPGEITKGNEATYRHGLFGFQVSAGTENSNAAQQILQYNTKENALVLAKKINSIQQYFVEKTRLGIPMIAFDEALHGLVRDGATVFPQSIGLAASWDTQLMTDVASAIAKETSIRGIRQVLSPVINIATDVRWGRTEETYGEDPYLTSTMGIAFMRAFEQQNIITTPKHFIANVGDGGRDSYPIYLNERFLQNIHYPPFINAIKKAGARSIMTAYNAVDGSPATANHQLLNETLKKQWGFTGFVISDASAVGGANVLHYTAADYADASQQAITNGLDVIFQTQHDHYRLFIPPFLNGKIPQTRIDDAVTRVLKAKFELGLFEHPYINETLAADSGFVNEHKKLAKQAAMGSIVLLKNIHQTLPLSSAIQKIALLGEDAVEARPGGYSGNSHSKVSILQGLHSLLPNSTIHYSKGSSRKLQPYTVIPQTYLFHQKDGKKKNGLQGDYFANVTLTGNPTVTRVDEHVNFYWTLYPPDPSLPLDFYSVRWNGYLRAPQSGKYQIGLEGNDGFRLYINNKLMIDQWDKQSYHQQVKEISLRKDEAYAIRIEFKEPNGNAHIQLIWNYDLHQPQDKELDNAVSIVQQADVAIIVAGIEEGEFRDRASLQLPGNQQQLIKAVAATGKKVIVVLIGGSAITMNDWINDVDAIVHAWYPGEQGGHAVADILFGKANPSGKLPVTFPLSEAQLPLVYNHAPTGRGDDYNNLSGLPLFPFGYGLSYTEFNYSDLELKKQEIKTGDSTWVTCTITNTGPIAGSEVVQLYLRDMLSSVSRPVMELKGFQKVYLLPGESKQVQFLIHPEMLEMPDVNMNKVIEPGEFRIMIGSSSRDIRLKTNLNVIK